MPQSQEKTPRYSPASIEEKWQRIWEETGAFRAEDEGPGEPCYLLVEFPYPSGDGLHVGHVRSYTAMDVVARKRRAEGRRVLFPMGWDAFGLPTENFAIKTGTHPAEVTRKNTDTFRRQLKALGFSFDWSREVSTTDPDFYRWTQWMFTCFFRAGLAYKGKAFINWCPKDQVGLANEEVVAGACERCGTPVVQREKEQWMMRITEYADKLLAGLGEVDFLPQVRAQQENWIGRREGVELTYPVAGSAETVTVFTTRPETNFGATFVALSPSHPLAEKISSTEYADAVAAYVAEARSRKADARGQEAREKTGVFTGAHAINHLTGRHMPVYVSDFVLDGVGTGALVGVPGHDLRDFEFAAAFGLDVVRVVAGEGGDTSEIATPAQVWEGDGTLVNSGFLDGKGTREAARAVAQRAEEQGWGRRTVAYHLRDWVFSRQRYWGEPIPMVHCERCGWVPVPDEQLPVLLPEVASFAPGKDGESPLASAEEWIKVPCPSCGAPGRRETDVMPQWAGSSWYFLRYVDPQNGEAFADPEKLRAWMPVSWYNGGMEHTTLHLLYSRFWNRFLFDQGLVPAAEPYAKRTSQGMVLGAGGVKMSKSRGNVTNPDDVVRRYGADTLRGYEMFMGPFGQAIPWDDQSIEGVHRFLARAWTLAHERHIGEDVEDAALLRAAKRTARKVGEDIESMSFNTAISAMMVLSNELARAEQIPQQAWELFLVCLAPFAPHLAEELWAKLGHVESVARAPWPQISAGEVAEEVVRVAVQVNGKSRGEVEVPASAEQEQVEAAARALPKVAPILEGVAVRVIYVPGRVINFVV